MNASPFIYEQQMCESQLKLLVIFFCYERTDTFGNGQQFCEVQNVTSKSKLSVESYGTDRRRTDKRQTDKLCLREYKK